MKMFILLIGTAVILSSGTASAKEKAKDIFKDHGFNKAPLTLSKGEFDEFFTNEEVVQIGTVLLNTKTYKIVAFLDEDTTNLSYQAESSSRWLSPDPLAEKYPSVSPYAYCLNNPIRNIDPDGKDVVVLIAKDGASGMGHMAAVVQDAKGNCFYLTQGAAENGSLLKMSTSGVQGGMSLVPLNTKDMNEAVNLAKSDKNNSAYTDQLKFETSKKQDENIFKSATELQKETNSGEKKYNVITNNCVDAVQETIEKGTKVDLPVDVDPRPNEYFKKLQENQKDIQKDLDKNKQ